MRASLLPCAFESMPVEVPCKASVGEVELWKTIKCRVTVHEKLMSFRRHSQRQRKVFVEDFESVHEMRRVVQGRCCAVLTALLADAQVHRADRMYTSHSESTLFRFSKSLRDRSLRDARVIRLPDGFTK